MALALSVEKDGDDYVLVEHAGDKMRIAVHSHPTKQHRAVVILLADDDSGEAPDKSWRLLRKAVREREGG